MKDWFPKRKGIYKIAYEVKKEYDDNPTYGQKILLAQKYWVSVKTIDRYLKLFGYQDLRRKRNKIVDKVV